MILICLFSDAIEGLVSFIGLVPVLTPITIFIGWVINITTLAIISIWFIMKGKWPIWFFVGSGAEFIPVINILPLRTAACITAIIKFNYTPSALKEIKHPIKKWPKHIF